MRFKLIGKNCNCDAIGAEVEVQLKDRKLRQQVMPTRSYLSQVELPITFGLGTDSTVQSVTIHWPDGTVQGLEDVEVDRLHTIEQSRRG